MPELPEVETIRRDLADRIAGSEVVAVEGDGGRAIRRHRSISEISSAIAGRSVSDVRRLGKYLVLDLTRQAHVPRGEPGDPVAHLVIHLGMSGQLRWYDDRCTSEARHTHLVVRFSPRGELHFVDPRTFGEVFVCDAASTGSCARSSGAGDALAEDSEKPDGTQAGSEPSRKHRGRLGGRVPERDGSRPTELDHIGVDALDPLLTPRAMEQMLGTTRAPIKSVLMNQRIVAGIGNIYSDEILFAAGVRYDRPASSLTAEEIALLHGAMVSILEKAVEERGSSLADLQYRDLFGNVGSFQDHHEVHARAGAPCPRCGSLLESAKSGGRTTSFCRRCQR